MKHTFGPFELDESGRSLTLRGKPQPLQPRVFDLLAYLVNNAGRVVPKDELLDVLWPNVIVTESSLQRAASLARRALAAGGLGDAIRNFAKHGYRFALDDPGLGMLAVTGPQATVASLAAAREAVLGRDWKEASRHFATAAATASLNGDDLDLWAYADECRGFPVEAIPALVRAVEAHLAAGHADRAARSAVTLAKVELERAAMAAAQGWLERADSILRDTASTAVHAYAFWMKSRLAAFEGNAEGALAFGAKASELAEQSGDQGLRALALVYWGFFHMSLGYVSEGRRLQNHAAAIALSSRVDPITGTLVYCNILWSCHTSADWERALQWSEGFESWCGAAFAEHPGACDLHRAAILGARGTLDEALALISDAIPKLSEEENWALAEGYRVRGDVAAMAGDTAAAAADYATAYSLGWDAEPGNALLLFERGDVDGALAALDRALQGQTWFHLQRRGILLVNAALIAALAGRRERAERYLAEVSADDDRWPQPTVRAMIAETKAALLPASDPQSTQLRLLARQLWTSGKIDYQAARVRLELVRTYIATGDIAGAEAELGAAERTARRIGSRRLIADCAELRRQLSVISNQRSASVVTSK
jgi:tetratricopeptide (TPR) repeat protein